MSKGAIALLILMLIGGCLFLNLALPRELNETQVEATKVAFVRGELSYARTATVQTDYRMTTATAQVYGATATAAWQATQVQQIAERNNANATAQAAQATAQYLNHQATATMQEVQRQATATMEAMRRQETLHAEHATQTAVAQQKTETAEAMQRTAQAEATATERAWIITQTTQAGYTTQTAQVAQATATRQADLAAMQRTAEAVQAESMTLALERERMTNTINALVPWLLGIAVAIVLLFILWRWAKVQQVGNVLVVDGRTIYDPDRNPLPWMTVLDGGQVDAPMLAPENLHAETTRRDQAIDALRAMPAGQARPPRGVFAPPAPQQQAAQAGNVVKIEVVQAEAVKPWLDEVAEKYLPDTEEK